MKQYLFYIEELCTEREKFGVLHPWDKDPEDIVEEAARLFYYGKAGWKEAWPLTFVIESLKGLRIAKAHVFILSSQPKFEAILLK